MLYNLHYYPFSELVHHLKLKLGTIKQHNPLNLTMKKSNKKEGDWASFMQLGQGSTILESRALFVTPDDFLKCD